MKDKDLKSRLKSLGLRRPSSSYVDKVLAQKPEALEAGIRRPWYGRRIWIYASIVAAIFLFVAVGMLHFLPSGGPGVVQDNKVKIPAELTQMPVEKLLEIHFGKIETSFDSKTVVAAVKVALDKLSPRQILDIGTSYVSQADLSASSRPPYHPLPLSEVVEASDLVVRARVDAVTLDVDDLKAAIVKKKTNRFSIFVAWVKAIVDLHVFEGYPSLPPLDEEKLTLWPVLSTDNLDAFKVGEEYLIALQQDGDIIWMLPYTEGVYPVDANNGMVSGFRSGEMPLDEAWEFIMDTYDVIHQGVEPSGEVLDYWLANLQSDDLTDCWTAVEYFNTLVKPTVRAEAVADAIERQLKMRIEKTDENWRQFGTERFQRTSFVKEALDLVIQLGDQDTNDRMLELYERERSSDKSIFNEKFAGIYARGFSERIARLAPREAKQETSAPSGAEKPTISRKERIQGMIDKYQQDESKSNLNRVINLMRKLLEPEDRQFIPFLRENVTSHWVVPILIAERLPDPCFVPVIRQALEKEVTGTLLAALFACGEEEEAIEMAVTELDKLLHEENGQMLGGHLYKLFPVIRFLGTTGDESVLPVIENFTREDVIDTLRETDARFGGQYAFIVDKLQQDAVLALARLGGESAIPRLKQLYQSDDIHIRILAALSLYYFGDDTGYSLLSHFINNTHRSVPEIEVRWHVDLAGGYAFQVAIMYLRSPRTDALLLEKLRHGVDSGDMYAFSISAFFNDYQQEILLILVEQLGNRDRQTRKYANEILKRLTGQDFGFQPDRFVGQQDEAVEQWRSYVDYYLTGQ